MEIIVKEKISNILRSDKFKNIIESQDFYFQKAKDLFHEFINFNFDENQKQFLLQNRKEYEILKNVFENDEQYKAFGKIIFSLISYCDSNAYKKQELNEYGDKRVLALAYVRMNNWIEQLIAYKFGEFVPDGSIKNAINYLLDPLNNFTMLSENHRKGLSENLFGKPYFSQNFKTDFDLFFEKIDVNIINPDNQSHLLSRLMYEIKNTWKDSIIGIMASDGTGWQNGLIQDENTLNYAILWNSKRPSGTDSTLKLLKECIEENGHFKLFYTSNGTVQYVAEIIDFVQNEAQYTKAEWADKYGNIQWYYENYKEYSDGNKSASIVFLANKFYKVNPINIDQFKLFKGYSYPTQDNLSPIESYTTNTEKLKIKTMNNQVNLLNYKKQIILQGPPGTGKTREAKIIAKEMLGLSSVDELENNEQFKLVQFHPGYTYEDFVRGIVAKPNEEGEGVIYGAENKTLGKFAEEAQKNYLANQGKTKNNINFQNKLNVLLEKINTEINQGSVYYFGEKSTAQIISIKEDGLIYNFQDRQEIKYKILFNDMEKVYNNWNEVSKPIDLRDLEGKIGLTMKGKYPYYYMIQQRLIAINTNKNNPVIKEDLKNYILVIDEINRANLSSVLGELIYALEYRGESVESMYEVDGSQKLVLPPNLYIIGTMNTADRSVGHIDYAIRRRFAFVNVPPRNLKSEDGMQNFDEILFNQVSELFDTNRSSEFEKEHIQLGHSYFIDKSNEGAGIAVRLEYEIKPILEEYIRDGVLIGENIKEKVANLQTSL